MRTKVQSLSFDQIEKNLSNRQFDVRRLPGVANRLFAAKYGAGAVLAQAERGQGSLVNVSHPGPAWSERPGWVLAGRVATLLDRGYQKFWKAGETEIPATAGSLQAVHRFTEELHQAIGEPSLYNQSLGTTSDVYLYDRLRGRES